MRYAKIDTVLEPWSKKNGFQVLKEYKDDEVRAVEKHHGKKRLFQIWLDSPDIKGLIGVHVWDFKKRRRDFLVSYPDLEEYLDATLAIANNWFK